MPAKDQTALRTPSGRVSRAKPGAVRGGSKPAGELPVRTRLTLHATAPEAEAVKAAAKAAGLSESAWLRRAAQVELAGPAVRLEWRVYSQAADLCLCIGGFSAPVLQMYPGQWAFSADGRFFGPEWEATTKAQVVEYVRALGMPVQMPPFPGEEADHARQFVAHLEAVGGMPSATP